MNSLQNATSEEALGYRYWAFISYSHDDKRWGDWLHRGLETYRVPRHRVGTSGVLGPVPRGLSPVVREREEFSASPDLGTKVARALGESRYLIVICSPRSARSRGVNEELKYFKRLHGEERILALIVAGEPNAAARPGTSGEQECFPEALRFKLGANGELSPTQAEPIAGDVRGARYA